MLGKMELDWEKVHINNGCWDQVKGLMNLVCITRKRDAKRGEEIAFVIRYLESDNDIFTLQPAIHDVLMLVPW